MFRRFGTMMLLSGMLVGCGKPSSSYDAPDPAEADSVSSSSESDPVESRVPSQEIVSPPMDHMPTVLAHLTQAVRKYAAEKQQVPAGLEELAASGYLSRIPEAPVGKRFAIDKKLQVYLADQ